MRNCCRYFALAAHESKIFRFFLVRLGLFLLLVLGLVLLPACANKKGGQTAGSTGDYVTGTPLPERQEGTSFFSGNVERNQFQPIYFDFDSQTIRSSENGKIQQVASFLQQRQRPDHHRRLHR